MDDDQFQGGLSGQGGNPVPANNSNTYDFTNGDPLASLDNPEAAARAAAEADPADNIAVDPLANEPIMDLTNNVNISAPELPEEPEATAPAEEPEGPISEMSRRMDIELGNIDGAPSQADVPTEEPVAPEAESSSSISMEPVSPALPTMDADAPTGEPEAEPTPQILGPESTSAEETPEQNVETAAMSFETTEIPGQTPAPTQSDDIPSFAGESRPSVATVNNGGKKQNKSLIIILIAAVVLIGGIVAAMMIIPNLNSRKKGNTSNNGNQSSQNNTPADPDDNDSNDSDEDQDEDENVVKTKVVGRVDKGYVTVPENWKQILDPNDETLVKYTDEDGDFTVFLNAGPITEVTAEGFANLQLEYSKEEAKEPETLKASEKTIGDFSMTEIKYFSTANNKYTYKYVFESAKSGYTYFIWMECSDEKSEFFTSIPKSFSVAKK